MTKEQYERWSAPFRKTKWGVKILTGIDRTITMLIFFSYPALLVYLFFSGFFHKMFFCIAIPAVLFLIVSLFRKLYSAPRPYEILDIQPLIKKETKGKSFPSRHVFSVFIIGMTYFFVYKPAGIVIGMAGVVLAYVRVAAGVHFPKDTVAGALCGILGGLLYLMI